MTPLPDLSIRQLEYLVAVADSPTWAAAADRVGVSPSALSQGLAEFERRLGVSVFERDGRRRVMRSGAAPALAHARQVLALTGDLSTWAGRLRDATTGRVRIGMIDAAAVIHYPEVLRRFRADRPDVDVHLTVAPSGELIAQLVGGALDVVVCVEPGAPVAGLEVDPLRTEELVVYGPPDTDIGPPATWGPWVLFPNGSHTRFVIADALREIGSTIDVVAESHQPEVLREMVVLGMGWTVLPSAQAGGGDPLMTEVRSLGSRLLVVARRSATVSDPAVDALVAALAATTPGD